MDDTSDYIDGDLDNEITAEEQEWAVAMANENILDSNFNKDILLLDTVKRLQKQNKLLGKLFKEQKKNYHTLSNNLEKRENLAEIKDVIRSKRIKIYKEMKILVDLEKNLAENCDDTGLKNMIGVKPKEVVDLKLLDNGLYKCTQCTCAKNPKGDTWNWGDFLYVLFIYNTKLSVIVHSL